MLQGSECVVWNQCRIHVCVCHDSHARSELRALPYMYVATFRAEVIIALLTEAGIECSGVGRREAQTLTG